MIRRARKQAHLTQEQVAVALGVPRPYISDWENDKDRPDVEEFRQLMELTGAAWLVEFFVTA
jgi:transcriptional regulator with XRE-family HTH domain